LYCKKLKKAGEEPNRKRKTGEEPKAQKNPLKATNQETQKKTWLAGSNLGAGE
jgi:hypothetical protein